MNWIKKRYDQFLLALLTVALLACAILIFLRVQSFGEKFSDAVASVIPNNKVPPVPLDRIDQAKEKLQTPPQWTNPVGAKGEPLRGSLFVSDHYIISPEGTPQKPDIVDLYKDSLTGEKIPSKWFLDNNLPLLDAKVPMQDPDKDGFTNEDEWRAKTDPNNKDSHPPYWTKLFLKHFEKVAFRLVFKSYDGIPTGPKKDPIEKFSFQIDTIDLHQPSEFLKVGDMVPHTKFKLEKFEYKTAYNKQIEDTVDVSELTLVDTITADKIVLILNRVTDSPDVYANFEYEWPQPTQLIRVKKLQEFVLKPEVDDTHHYKLIDINDTEAQIKLPDGTDYTVKMDPRHAGK
ncbi:MAG: Amuc_1099 family pilus-like system protein [Chthoniobacter sp.]|uniref:Amuc_1099 family pilus-like system protein n=1 Tax=Chthoniobacter sp. TaxID=2510640 RepID=UPI0032A66705